MREDMFKVIVERPRGGKGWAVRSRKKLNQDGDLPAKVGIRRHMWMTGAKSKFLNENLAPLRRYLGRQVGRRWDDVYSEISATLSTDHTVKAHVRQHLDDFVARRVTFDSHGNPVAGGDWRPYFDRPWRQLYYVDPCDGVLKESAAYWKALGLDPNPKKRNSTAFDPDLRVLGTMRELRRIGGLWYAIGYRRQPQSDHWVFDLVRREMVPARERYAAAKRQLSRDELIAHRLKNTYND